MRSRSWSVAFLTLLVLALSTALGGCLSREPGQVDGANSVVIKLYFVDRDGYLVAENRTVENTPELPRVALQLLMEGPRPESGLLRTIPATARLRNLVIKNGLATADFSREIQTEHGGGALDESITVYSIVNTLAQFPSVKQVQILVEGEQIQSLAGHLDLTEPVVPNFNLVRR
ncbi:MAG: GerMN domain-containing protein [Bacillota bacterium]